MNRRNLRVPIGAILLLPGVVTASLAAGPTKVGGPLPADATWTRDASPYVLSESVAVPKGRILRIEPGVRVECVGTSIVVAGTLIARGTPGAEIVFTSGREKPAPGDWGGLRFDPGSNPARFQSNGRFADGSVLESAVVEYGGGIVMNGSAPWVSQSVIRHNLNPEGGGIFAFGGRPVITYNTISHNCSERDGGGIRTAKCVPLIVGNTIVHNAARVAGGGIATDFAESRIAKNTIAHNLAVLGGGIATGIPRLNETVITTASHSRPTIEDNAITHNIASSNGGGVYVSGSPTFTGNRLVDNLIEFPPGRSDSSPRRDHARSESELYERRSGNGAGMMITKTYGGPARIRRNVIVGNAMARWGGGIFLQQGNATIEENLFAGNRASEFGGAISLIYCSPYEFPEPRANPAYRIGRDLFRDNDGGAVEFAGNGEQNVVVEDCRFETNPVDESDTAIVNHSRREVIARGNAAGVRGEDPIKDRIFDHLDRDSAGPVKLAAGGRVVAPGDVPDFEPDLYRPAITAPMGVRAGQGFDQVPGRPVALTIAWNPPDGWTPSGYRIYVHEIDRYGKDPRPARADSGVSPFDSGPTEATKKRLLGLKPNSHYEIHVTAYDAQRRESAYSKKVSVYIEAN